MSGEQANARRRNRRLCAGDSSPEIFGEPTASSERMPPCTRPSALRCRPTLKSSAARRIAGGNIDGTGNALDNEIYGNSHDNDLIGGAGATIRLDGEESGGSAKMTADTSSMAVTGTTVSTADRTAICCSAAPMTTCSTAARAATECGARLGDDRLLRRQCPRPGDRGPHRGSRQGLLLGHLDALDERRGPDAARRRRRHQRRRQRPRQRDAWQRQQQHDQRPRRRRRHLWLRGRRIRSSAATART